MTTAPTRQPFGEAWIAEYFADVDRLDPASMLRWYAEDCSFRFGGNPTLRGKSAIAAALAGFYGTIAGMRHEMTGCWIDRDAHSGVWEAEVTFTRPDGSRVTIPAISSLRLRDGLIHDFRFVMDPAPLHGTDHG
ncbi:MAG: nuclear transport factor 2 family protein [Gluconacetobacter diazotrophicus]|nr:nuclear transport factor 2 family protein [Gluconacetobacter diazotrophicus]